MFDSDSSVFAAVRAGAKGYLLKGADQQDVERAIRTVAAGEAVFGTAIAARLVSLSLGLGRGD
jgi:DNA-binding NarL/FixJ family response regulator